MARPSNTRERRTQIAEAMLTVMASDGYERASIAAIARTAGLAPGLIHYHFRSKQDILLAVIEQIEMRVRERYRTRVDQCGDEPRERLFALIDAHVALGPDADERAVAAWVNIGAEAVSQPRIRDAYAAVVEDSLTELSELFAACLRHAGQSVEPADRYAAAVMAAIEGAYQLAAVAPGSIPRGFAAPTLRQFVDGLLSAGGKSP